MNDPPTGQVGRPQIVPDGLGQHDTSNGPKHPTELETIRGTNAAEEAAERVALKEQRLYLAALLERDPDKPIDLETLGLYQVANRRIVTLGGAALPPPRERAKDRADD